MNNRHKSDEAAAPQPGDELLGDLLDSEVHWEPKPPFDPDDHELQTADRER